MPSLEEHAGAQGGEEDAEACHGEVGGAPAPPVPDDAPEEGGRVHEPHHEREEGEGIQHPLVLAALMARRGEQEEDEEGISPLLLATLMGRRKEREKETV